MILGIDEVGRGPWAGPLVVGAVVLNDEVIDGLTDSKKLSKKRREELSELILQSKADVGLGWVYPDEIDRIGLSQSLIGATKQAVGQITSAYYEIIIDGTVNFLKDTTKGEYVTNLKKADLLIPSVSAASIVAKVARDEYMAAQDKIYPQYGFGSHVGYGTAVHRAAIDEHGVTPLHRLSFAPLKKYQVNTEHFNQVLLAKKSTKSVGDEGETVACQWLEQNGYKVIERNWKTKMCEIDIVAQKGDTVYFVEVKHRHTSTAGGEIGAITPSKLRQMEFAAKLYMYFHQLTLDGQLLVVTTHGEAGAINFESYIELK